STCITFFSNTSYKGSWSSHATSQAQGKIQIKNELLNIFLKLKWIWDEKPSCLSL
ncbi:hypothetical protein L9F63_005677, partial [Diploptera punctata]